MKPNLPAPVPEIPVGELAKAIAFYQSRMGFVLDWKYEDGIAGVSCGEARLFLNRVEGKVSPVRVWLNLGSVAEVDALYKEWLESGVGILAAPELKPWGLHEFIAADLEGNSYRVFYDTATPAQCAAEGQPKLG